MAVFDLDSNALFGENGTGKLFIATDYDGTVFDKGTGTNEPATVAALDAYTFADVGYFENFAPFINQGDERIITTDYCGVGEVMSKRENVEGFSVDVQEILEMENLALILGDELNVTGVAPNEVETIVRKRTMQTKPYHLFKFVTCPKEGKTNVFYFVKSRLSNDVTIPVNNLSREDFAGTTLEFEVAKSGNFVISKESPHPNPNPSEKNGNGYYRKAVPVFYAKMRDYPAKKTFVQDFVTGDETAFSVRYEQATLAEFFEFTAKTPEERLSDAIETVRSQLPANMMEKALKRVFKNYRTKFEKSVDWITVASSVIANRFRSYDSAFDSVPSSGKKGKGLFSVGVMKVCGHYSVSPSELFEKHTLEQFFWLLEGVRYWENAQTKEGAKINDFALTDRKSVLERAKKTREAFEKHGL